MAEKVCGFTASRFACRSLVVQRSWPRLGGFGNILNADLSGATVLMFEPVKGQQIIRRNPPCGKRDAALFNGVGLSVQIGG